MKHQAFWVNGVPHFFYGGEMHYFRVPETQWETQLQRIRELGVTTVSTYVPWLWHEPTAETFDFSGRTHPQRNLVRFLAMASDVGLTVFIRPGPYVMAELRQEGIPSWVFTEYPEVLAQGIDGKPHPIRMASYGEPRFLQLVDRWYSQLALAIRNYFVDRGGPIIMTQLDNEIGMLHWVSGIADHHPRVQAAYREYARVLGNTSKMDYWGHAQFWRDYRAQYVSELKRYAAKAGFPAPYVINVHGFRDFSIYSRGVDYPVGVSQLAGIRRDRDMVLGGDFYPGHVTYDNFHDLALATLYTRAVNDADAAAFSPEFQSGRFQDRPHINPSDLDLAARISIAYGLNGLNWYMLSSGENPEQIGVFGRHHDWQAPLDLKGQHRPSAAIVSHLGALIRDYGMSLAGSHVQPEWHLGLYSAYYLTEEAAGGPSAPIVNQIMDQRERFHFDGIYRVLVAANIQLGALWIDAPDKALDARRYPSLWVATTRYMDESTQARLATYVLSGGRLVIGPEIPDRDLQGHPCGTLRRALGLPEVEHRGDRGVTEMVAGDTVYCPSYVAFEESPAIEVKGRLAETHEVTVFAKEVDAGKIMVVGIGWSALYDRDYRLVRELATEFTGRPPRIVNDNPLIHVSVREGTHGQFLFVHNLHDYAEETRISLSDRQFDGIVWSLSLSPRQGLLLPFGGTPIAGRQWVIDFTTAEITVRPNYLLCIHRSQGHGEAKFRSTGLRHPGMTIVHGSATLAVRGEEVTVRWQRDLRATPIWLDYVGRQDLNRAPRENGLESMTNKHILRGG